MIVEIPEIIDIIDDFISAPYLYDLDIGGCIGTNIFKLCMEEVMAYYPFIKILIIEGCQDFIEMQNTFLGNHIFYAEAVDTNWSNSYYGEELSTPIFMRHKPTIDVTPVNFNKFSIIIINDAHLIPQIYLNTIRDNYMGKIIKIADPFDYGGELFMHSHTVIDSLSKLSQLQAYARSLFNIDTRTIDKKVICSLKKLDRMTIRSVGVSPDKRQYVTPYNPIINLVKDRRRDQLRKGQKIICRSNFVNTYRFDDTSLFKHVFTYNSLGTLQTSRQLINGLYKVRLHNSKHSIHCDLTMNPEECIHSNILVEPANIISLEDMKHHKFNSINLILPEDGTTPFKGMSKRELYSVLRCTTDLKVGYIRMRG